MSTTIPPDYNLALLTHSKLLATAALPHQPLARILAHALLHDKISTEISEWKLSCTSSMHTSISDTLRRAQDFAAVNVQQESEVEVNESEIFDDDDDEDIETGEMTVVLEKDLDGDEDEEDFCDVQDKMEAYIFDEDSDTDVDEEDGEDDITSLRLCKVEKSDRIETVERIVYARGWAKGVDVDDRKGREGIGRVEIAC